MCTRFAQAESPEDLCARFNAQPSPTLAKLQQAGDFPSRYNLSANQPVLVITLGPEGKRELTPMWWGLVPAVGGDPKAGTRLINARAETITKLSTVSPAFHQRRCLIPASAYYEWRKEGSVKQPYAIRRQDHAPFVFAGIWEEWRAGTAEARRTCSIITTTANSLVTDLNSRMPVILPIEDEAAWLEPAQHVDLLRAVLQPYPSDELEMYPVSVELNRVSSEGASLLTRQEELAAA